MTMVFPRRARSIRSIPPITAAIVVAILAPSVAAQEPQGLEDQLRGEEMEINPESATELPADGELVHIGSVEAEDRFLEIYP